jgi:predicted O-methyltransferase YrrM
MMINPIENWLALDEYNIQMPWYVRPFLEILDTWDLKGKIIFEYGSGYSSLWFRSRGATVYGVDSNETWANLSGARFCDDKQAYLDSINWVIPHFDIVVIDGIYRDECTKYALNKLNPEGILIIDNWDQPSAEPNEWLETKELIKGLKMEVYKEPEHEDWKTAVITK